MICCKDITSAERVGAVPVRGVFWDGGGYKCGSFDVPASIHLVTAGFNQRMAWYTAAASIFFTKHPHTLRFLGTTFEEAYKTVKYHYGWSGYRAELQLSMFCKEGRCDRGQTYCPLVETSGYKIIDAWMAEQTYKKDWVRMHGDLTTFKKLSNLVYFLPSLTCNNTPAKEPRPHDLLQRYCSYGAGGWLGRSHRNNAQGTLETCKQHNY